MKYPDKVYLSKTDLNIENSEIEVPFKPVVRITYPVLTDSGKKIGLIVINVKFEKILSRIHDPDNEIKSTFYVINQKGYWLKGPSRDLEWGFMFDSKKDNLFSLLYPNAWKLISQSRTGQFINNEGLFSYYTIPNFETSGFRKLNDRVVNQDPVILISFIEKSAIFSTFFNYIIFVYAGVVLLITLLSFFWAGMKIKKKEKDEAILKLNVELEDKVKERTSELEISKEFALQSLKHVEELKEQVAAANMVKSVFLANISHETRTPLNSIIGFSDLLHSKNKDSDLDEYIESIKSSSRTLLYLINEILDTSKLEAGKVELELSQVNLNSLTAELRSIFSGKTRKKGLNFIVEISSELPTSVELDKLRIRQVAYNLLSNAIKFTEKGFVKFSLEAGSNSAESVDLIIKVADSGIGIPEQSFLKIFEYFKQNDDSTTRKYEGIGLGLSTSKKIVELLGGNIHVESEVGKGSTFTVTIPGRMFSHIEDIKKNIPESDFLLAETSNSGTSGAGYDGIAPSVISVLKQNAELVWRGLENKRSIKLQKELAGIMIDTGMSIDDNYLKARGETLKQALITYNIEKVNAIMNELKECLK
jgi:signal transduction histidine kinase